MPFKKNIITLSKKNPQLAKLLETIPFTGRYKLMPSQRIDKLPTIYDFTVNQYYYNNYDPLIAARLDIEKRGILLPNFAIFLGFGAGYHIVEYLNKYPNANVLIIEADPEILKVASSAVNLSALFSYQHLCIISGLTPVQMYPQIFDYLNQSNLLQYLSSINIIDNNIAVNASKQFYVDTIKILKEAITNVLALYGNDPNDSLIGIQMTLRNLETIVDNPGVKELEGIFKGKPGIVVSTGPSLDKNIELLRGLQDKAVIVAPDATVKVLKKRGIKPAHLVTSLERIIETSKLFDGLTPEDVQDSYLAACPVVVPETYANFPGKKIIIYRNFATFKWIDIPKGILDIGPSAGNMAFKVLEYLGCDPIILIGQDLAFTDDEKTHAEGAHYGERSATYLNSGIINVPGNYSPTVKTSPVFHQFLRHYERDVASFKGEVINATEGGAKIEGTKLMTFKEAIDKYIKEDIAPLNTIAAKLKYTSEKIKINQVKELLKKMHVANDFSTTLVTKLREGVELCSQYEALATAEGFATDEAKQAEANVIIAKISQIQTVFNAQEFYLILMHYVQSYYIKASMDLNSYRFQLKPSLELNQYLVIKFKEFYSVIAALVDKINIEFVSSIEHLDTYLKKLNEK